MLYRLFLLFFATSPGLALVVTERNNFCGNDQWQCQNGICISFEKKCDGNVDCLDGSDETHPLCSGMRCENNRFQCTYGACVSSTALCNNITECADNSDELNSTCLNATDEVQPLTGACKLPPYPENGNYSVGGAPDASPGQNFDVVNLNISCNPGYGVQGNNVLYCLYGVWTDEIPQCVRYCEPNSLSDEYDCIEITESLQIDEVHKTKKKKKKKKKKKDKKKKKKGYCKLKKHPSVKYTCMEIKKHKQILRKCKRYEPSGTIVSPECRAPNYYYSGVLSFMRCIEGKWDHVAICTPECGTITAAGERLIIGGRSAKRGELPWHASIYRKLETPYMQICGGSLVTTTVVISAAHCFWSDVNKLLPASNYAVAVGKLYRPWNNPRDIGVQRSDVSDIKIPKRFNGVSANYQDDIALVFVSDAFEYRPYVRPVCMDFDVHFERSQLQVGNSGKVAGWGLTAENGDPSPVLKVVELPYIDIETCIADSTPGFRAYITSDKMCAGYKNATALCRGDSGGGLAFSDYDRGTNRYYLRGVVSTAPQNENACNANAFTSFTQIIRHEHFIKEHVVLNT